MAKYLLPMILGLGLVLTGPAAQDAFAGKGGGGGGGGGKGGGGGGGGGGGKGGGGSMHGPGGSGHPGGGYYHPGPIYRSGFYGGFYGGGLYYDPWYGYGAPYYYNDGYAVPPSVYVVPGAQTIPQMPQADPLGQAAQINLTLPQGDAKVWIDGNVMSAGSGQKRIFSSPSLESGYSYSYRVERGVDG